MSKLLIYAVLYIAWLPVTLYGQEANLKENGPDKRVGLTLVIDSNTLAPGEFSNVVVTRKVLCRQTLDFPDNGCDYVAALTRIYLRTPDSRLFVHWPFLSTRHEIRPLQARDFNTPLSAGQSTFVLNATVSMVNPSPGWIDFATGKQAKPNFRTIGRYELWAEYRIPKVNDAPADAWHGHVKSQTYFLTVRSVPLADRLTEPTAEQLADLKVMMSDNPNFGNKRLSTRRLKTALENTENEGLAIHIAGILKSHQLSEDNIKYPSWWNNLYFLLSCRAYLSGTTGIDGPYLTEFVSISLTDLKHQMAQSSAENGYNLRPRVDVGFLIAYSQTDGDEKAVLKKQLIKLARQHAKIPPTGNGLNAQKLADFKLSISWRILFAFGILHDDMLLSKAMEILGEPTLIHRDNLVEWMSPSSMHVHPRMYGHITQGAKSKTVRFVNGRGESPGGNRRK
jgi:hypothetical protein